MHFLLTHGPGPDDRQGRFLALTHEDSTKLVLVPVVLVAVALLGLRRPVPGRTGRVALGVALVGMAMVAVGISVVFWPIPWGSYTLDWTDPLPKFGGILQALGTLLMAVGLVGFGIERAKAGVVPWPAALLLALGAITTVPWLHQTVVGGLFGVAWAAVGIALLRRRAIFLSD